KDSAIGCGPYRTRPGRTPAAGGGPDPDGTLSAPTAALRGEPATVVAPRDDRPAHGDLPAGHPDTPTASAPPAETSRRGAPRARKPLVWGVVTAVLVAGLALGAYVLLMDGDQGEEAPAAPATPTPGRIGTPPTASTWSPPPPPRGYHVVKEEKLGISFPVPDGWTRKTSTSTTEAIYTDRTGLLGIRVNALDFASPDPVQHFKDVEEQVKERDKAYKRERMQPTSFRGQSAAVWEYTFSGRARAFRAVDLGFGREGGKEYALYFSAPDADWDRQKHIFDVLRDGFVPAAEKDR
ncbi:hypothetical protein AB0K09_14590, partial [Streptomyces sp. NPDC049577]